MKRQKSQSVQTNNNSGITKCKFDCFGTEQSKWFAHIFFFFFGLLIFLKIRTEIYESYKRTDKVVLVKQSRVS